MHLRGVSLGLVVDAVSCELVSAIFPDKQGRNREIMIFAQISTDIHAMNRTGTGNERHIP